MNYERNVKNTQLQRGKGEPSLERNDVQIQNLRDTYIGINCVFLSEERNG